MSEEFNGTIETGFNVDFPAFSAAEFTGAGAGEETAGAAYTESPAETEGRNTGKRRGRPAKTEINFTENLGGAIGEIPDIIVPEKKPRKKRSPKSANSLEVKKLQENSKKVISGVYAMAAKMLDAPYFAITPEEADSIAEPLAEILDDMNLSEMINKYGNGAALITAAAVVTIPRIVLYSKDPNNKIKNLKNKLMNGGNKNGKIGKISGSPKSANSVNNAETSPANVEYDFTDDTALYGGYTGIV
jgi:hypothetical protein